MVTVTKSLKGVDRYPYKSEIVEIKCPHCGYERVEPLATGRDFSEFVCCWCKEVFRIEYVEVED
jgi:transposase-like protein